MLQMIDFPFIYYHEINKYDNLLCFEMISMICCIGSVCVYAILNVYKWICGNFETDCRLLTNQSYPTHFYFGGLDMIFV